LLLTIGPRPAREALSQIAEEHTLNSVHLATVGSNANTEALAQAVHGLARKLAWIEVVANLLQAFDRLRVVLTSDRIEELAISPGPADILWRAVFGSCGQTRVGDAFVRSDFG